MSGKTYFLSDAHLGSLAFQDAAEKERRLVGFLDSIRSSARAVYLLGDMFDFWYEYRCCVPKGFVRFLGKVAELTDEGIEVHYLTGNHDMWCHDYFQRECGMILHREPFTVEIGGKTFFLAHGDGLGDPSLSFRLLRAIFHSPFCECLYSSLHPRWGITLGRIWARHSRLKRENGREPDFMGQDREFLVQYAKQHILRHPETDYLLFGHRHIELDLTLSQKARMLILGDWISLFTYAEFDGRELVMRKA